jgi:hypothetical protein
MIASLLLGCGPTLSEVVADDRGGDGSTTSPSSTSDSTTSTTPTTMGHGHEGSSGTTSAIATASDASTSATGDASTSSASSSSDASSSDASSSGGGPTCDELYGAAPGYLLCLETADECHFNATTGGGNCNTMCSLFGGTCLDAFDNSEGCEVIRPDMDTCATNRSTEICVCTK